MTLGVQAKLLVWATSDWGRVALRQGARLAVALLLVLAVALRPWLAPWLVTWWSATTIVTTIRDYRLFRRILNTSRERRSTAAQRLRTEQKERAR